MLGDDNSKLVEKDNKNLIIMPSSDKKEVENVEWVSFKDSGFALLVKDILGKDENAQISVDDINSITKIHIKADDQVNSIEDLSLLKNVNEVIIEKDVDNIENISAGLMEKNVELRNCLIKNIDLFRSINNIKEFKGKVNFSNDFINCGEIIFANGDKYIGEFTNGIIKNKGIYTYKNNGTLNGLFNDIDFSGWANLFYNNEEIKLLSDILMVNT